jgi:cytochrome c oxidase subunit 5b
MFKAALRATRPAVLATRAVHRQQVSRAFSTSLRVASGGPPPPELYGPGAKPGTVPTDLDQSTGLERLQLLGEIEGINVFGEGPLDSSRIGTKADPIRVSSYVRVLRLHSVHGLSTNYLLCHNRM